MRKQNARTTRAWTLAALALGASLLGVLHPAAALPQLDLPQRPFLTTAQQSEQQHSAATAPLIRSSISGLYVNAAHRPPPDTLTPGRNASSHALAPITLYFDKDAVDPRTAFLRVSAPRRRNWEEVTLGCGTSADGYPVGGIESCERDDLAAAAAAKATATVARTPDMLTAAEQERCEPLSVSVEEGELVFDPARCPAVASALSAEPARAQREKQDELLSFTFTVTADTVGSARLKDEHASVTRTWWVGHLRYERAKWPMAHDGDSKWDGVQPNKVSGLFHDPYIPRAAHFDDTDDLKGVDIEHSYWALGVSLRIPEVGLGDDMEAVHAPAGGEVVWVGKFRRPRPPAPENDEKGWVVMVRDQWGFVWQFFRLAKDSITVTPGDLIPQGHVLGAIRRSHLSPAPPVRRPPADPPLEKPDKGTPKYPFRFRSLQVNVVRPNAEWEEWKPPYVDGWHYFNPVHFLSEGSYFSNVPPYSDPATLFFARPSLSVSTPPLALLSSNDVVKPVLTGNIEILVAFDAFLESPVDPGDGMDAISLYALEWAVWAVGPEDGPGYAKNQCVRESERVRYKISFEHSKFPRDWNETATATSRLFAHYVPTFSYGPFRWARQSLSSQFDEKARALIYAPTRSLQGRADVRGSWDTRVHRNGMYWVSVRGRDYWGQVGCVTAQVRIFNL
ncbi:hypothetical protein OC834_006679 [Tilletia horrida]|nr:hypothetical protein OC834_006679 [Tilletia horrida]